ncbi:hypothetical protein [Methylovulum sp.]|uniref:hypothetical protein n=1 Tax=Methylovulum sp. TaxID=1916980 RepID=UPI0026093015|nr:hypothetical protein [Methylovulum sp.]
MPAYLRFNTLLFCVLVITNSWVIAENNVKANISIVPFMADSDEDKSIMENDLKNIEFVAKVNKHQSKSSDFLNIGVKVHNGYSGEILIADLQELCLENIVDPTGFIPELPRKISKIYTSRPAGGEKKLEWISVSAKTEKVIPLFVKNPSVILGKEKIMNGNYKIKFVCSINVRKANSVKILSVPLSSSYVEFDFTDNP